MNDLPPRTWQRWWLEWPKWFRISSCAAAVVVIVNIAVVMRITIGQIEPAEIGNLYEDHGIINRYFWELRNERFRGEHWLSAGIYGKNWSNIAVIERLRGDEASFRFVADRFPHLSTLSIAGDDVSAAGLKHLTHCRNLRRLILARSDFDDKAAASLANLPQVTSLNLSETLITDETLPVLRSMPNLIDVDVSYTDVSLDGIRYWKKLLPANRFKTDIPTSNFYGSYQPPRQSWETDTLIVRTQRDDRRDILGVIRWNDGTRSAVFQGRACRSFEMSTEKSGGKSFALLHSLSRSELHWNTRCWHGDGERQLQIELGEFASAPVSIPFLHNGSVIENVEFQMPCTKAEALASAKLK